MKQATKKKISASLKKYHACARKAKCGKKNKKIKKKQKKKTKKKDTKPKKAKAKKAKKGSKQNPYTDDEWEATGWHIYGRGEEAPIEDSWVNLFKSKSGFLPDRFEMTFVRGRKNKAEEMKRFHKRFKKNLEKEELSRLMKENKSYRL